MKQINLRLITRGGSGGGCGARTLKKVDESNEIFYCKFTSLITSGPALGMGGGCKNRTIIFCLYVTE
jgi:hypothetical protein